MVNHNFKLGAQRITGKNCAARGTTIHQALVVKALPDPRDPTTATIGVYTSAEDAAAVGAHVAVGADPAATKEAHDDALKNEV